MKLIAARLIELYLIVEGDLDNLLFWRASFRCTAQLLSFWTTLFLWRAVFCFLSWTFVWTLCWTFVRTLSWALSRTDVDFHFIFLLVWFFLVRRERLLKIDFLTLRQQAWVILLQLSFFVGAFAVCLDIESVLGSPDVVLIDKRWVLLPRLVQLFLLLHDELLKRLCTLSDSLLERRVQITVFALWCYLVTVLLCGVLEAELAAWSVIIVRKLRVYSRTICFFRLGCYWAWGSQGRILGIWMAKLCRCNAIR